MITRNGGMLSLQSVPDFPEIQLWCPPSSCVESHARELLLVLERYQREGHRRIGPGETIGHGYWILRAERAQYGNNPAALELFEKTSDGKGWVRGAALTLRYWAEQHAICEKAGAPFTHPEPDELVALSRDVLSGAMPVVGVRYEMSGKMSGWIINSAGYQGSYKTLRTEHMYHLTHLRPDIAKFIALPVGYRFRHYTDHDEVLPDTAT
jgi:hypothetical protein